MQETWVAPLLWKTPPQGNSPQSLGAGHTVSIAAESKACGITAPSARPSRGPDDLPAADPPTHKLTADDGDVEQAGQPVVPVVSPRLGGRVLGCSTTW